jgi:signal transduction histidine kinase
METGRPPTPLEGEARPQPARGQDELQLKLEAARTAAAERAVAEERQRIARELHDVVAHSVSVMTVQAGAVRRLLHPDQERERLALETIEATGREALTEMRRLVGLLRDQSATPDFAPQPSMGSLDVLLGTVREAGLPVDLVVEGTPVELPPGVDLAAYRVIQEALTNALKYAGPARACVTVRWKRGELELEVANDGTSEPGGDGGGHGLVGLRERVSLVGGSIESGPREAGGFAVTAHLPLGDRG